MSQVILDVLENAKERLDQFGKIIIWMDGDFTSTKL
jgi:hypothetical protein